MLSSAATCARREWCTWMLGLIGKRNSQAQPTQPPERIWWIKQIRNGLGLNFELNVKLLGATKSTERPILKLTLWNFGVWCQLTSVGWMWRSTSLFWRSCGYQKIAPNSLHSISISLFNILCNMSNGFFEHWLLHDPAATNLPGVPFEELHSALVLPQVRKIGWEALKAWAGKFQLTPKWWLWSLPQNPWLGSRVKKWLWSLIKTNGCEALLKTNGCEAKFKTHGCEAFLRTQTDQ